MWEVEGTDEFREWYDGLSDDNSDAVDAAVDLLAMDGPTLGRPWVDTLASSGFAKMKELRPRGGNLRIIFAFDPRRTAILLLGGDKTGQWEAWYRQAIPAADAMYKRYLDELPKEGTI